MWLQYVQPSPLHLGQGALLLFLTCCGDSLTLSPFFLAMLLLLGMGWGDHFICMLTPIRRLRRMLIASTVLSVPASV